MHWELLALTLTLLEEDVRDDCSAEGAGGVGRAALSQRPQTGLTEDVVAGVAHVRAEVHIQTHGADVTFPVPGAHVLLILTAAAGWVSCRALGGKETRQF